MRFSPLGLAVLLAAAPSDLDAQDFVGTFTTRNPQGAVLTLSIQRMGDSGYVGSLSGNGVTFRLQGVPEEDAVVGSLVGDQGRAFFEADLEGDGVSLTVVEPDANGQPNYATAQTIVFARGAAGARPGASNPLSALGAAPSPGGAPSQGAMQPPGIAQQPGQPNSAAALSPVGREWDNYLRGKRMTQLESYYSGSSSDGAVGGGYSSHRQLDLCSDGRFFYNEGSQLGASGAGVGAAAGGSGGGTGQWRIIEQGGLVGLDLRFTNGQVTQVRLTNDGQKVFVDGTRTYVTSDNSSCY